MVWAIGARTSGGAGTRHLTPLLTSPLEGGRDELGEGWRDKFLWVGALALGLVEGVVCQGVGLAVEVARDVANFKLLELIGEPE